jgi:hypothetical protein
MYIQSDELATIWLDDEDVRAAIHAKPVWWVMPKESEVHVNLLVKSTLD